MLRNIIHFSRRSKLEIGDLSKLCRHCNLHSSTKYSTNSNSSENASDAGKQLKEQSFLYRNIAAKILACGPITVADYMKEVLTNPVAGYYMRKDVFGKDGDFTTSPEITQLFGEMIGVWIVNEMSKITGGPIQLVELGPGRGTLCKDILKVFKQLKLIDKLSLHLVEISPAMASMQSKNLCSTCEEINREAHGNCTGHYRKGTTADGVEVFWYDRVEEVPKKFSVFLAHEFFDALPIHKFQKNGESWNEVLIDLDKNSQEPEKLRYVVTSKPTPASIFISKDEKRDHVEVSPATMVIVDYLASFLVQFGGFALIIDYGHSGDKTDTFRSFRRHEQQNPLANPGTADLTADVDFSLMKKIAQKDDRLLTFGPVNQRNFLKQLGIDVRLQILMKNAKNEDEKRSVESGYKMIMDEDKMGNCFQAFSMFPGVLREHLSKWPVVGFHDDNPGVNESNQAIR